MSSRPRRSFRRNAYRRGAASLLGVGLVLAACGGGVGGSAVLPRGAVATISTGSTVPPPAGAGDGQITVPSGGPATASGSATATSAAVKTSVPTQITATVAPPGPVPAELGKFYGQKLSWGGCVDYATTADDAKAYSSKELQCARLVVPLAYADPTGKTISVGLLRKQAIDQAGRIGSVLIDPGGPGASGMSFTAGLALSEPAANGGQATPAIAAELNKRFDLIGFDPRGVGSSLPAVKCETDAEIDGQRTVVPRSRNSADVDAANAERKTTVRNCAARIGVDHGIDGKAFLANVGTRDVARDLDVMRAALGDAKLTYAGFSYGTKIGWTYAEQFPRNVRAMVLDGVVSPDHDPATSDLAQIGAFQAAFNDFATWCAAKSPGCVLGSDPAHATAVFQSLVRPLLDKPLPLKDGRELSFSDAITGTTQALYFDSFRSLLAGALLTLSRGDGSQLMVLADLYDERDRAGHYSSTIDAFNAVRCVDNQWLTDPADITKFNAAYAKAAPFQDNGDPPGAVADICAYWPVKPTGSPHKLSAPGLPKVLIISTTGDPATPYQNGVDVSKQINSALLTVKGTRHTAYLTARLGCVNNIGNAYLEDLTLPADGTTCA